MYMEQALKYKSEHSGIDIELPRDDIMDLCLGKKKITIDYFASVAHVSIFCL